MSGSSQWNCSAVGNISLINGKINKWKIQIEEMNNNYIVFGIVPKNIDLNAIDNWKNGYITCSSNFAKHNLGVCSKFAEREAKKGSIIEIIVDLEMGKMFHFDLFYNEYFYVNLL